MCKRPFSAAKTVLRRPLCLRLRRATAGVHASTLEGRASAAAVGKTLVKHRSNLGKALLLLLL
jgi:hypothetical protein